MVNFFNDDVLLNTNGVFSKTAKSLYNEVKDLPIIDYHCHLNQKMIKDDAKFTDIGELWLSGDHYKWRAMRLCGVNEEFITGSKSYKEKFFKYCEIMPKLIGNPLYYWSHLELKQVFQINLPINLDNAQLIYDTANKKLKDLSCRKLLKMFNVRFVATTDDPIDSLENNGVIEDTIVSPTFRPDKLLSLDDDYLAKLQECVGYNIDTLDDLEKAISERLNHFILHGCKISDHGFKYFPKSILSKEEAKKVFKNRKNESLDNLDALRGYLMIYLMRLYKDKNIICQLHYSVVRNVNSKMFNTLGVDQGFDIMSDTDSLDSILNFINYLSDDERPTIILYTLNPNAMKSIATLSGAFRNVYIGAAWWFNDTLNGIKDNLSIISEYSVLGTNLGMLTDSRSFSSYSRFDFFRRILSSFVAEKVDRGEYPFKDAIKLVKDISLNNIMNLLGVNI